MNLVDEQKLLILRNFRKSYGNLDLQVDAEFPVGINAILGPSGSGKTTTLNCIAGLITPDSGDILLNGQILFSKTSSVNLPPHVRRLGYVFQESLLFPHISVKENLLFGFRLLPESQRKIDVDQLIEFLHLGPLLQRFPNTLSGGERQRVALGRSLATSPRLLLLDEPLASVDLLLRGQILRYLRQVWKSFEISIIYVSHSISEILALCSQAYVLVDGRLIASGSAHEILSQPNVAQSIGIAELENFLTVKIIGHNAKTGLSEGILGKTKLNFPIIEHFSIGSEIMVSIQARDIILTKEIPEAISTRNILRARIKQIQDLSGRALVYLDLEQQLIAEISQGACTELEIREGQDIFLLIKSNSVVVMDG